MLRLNTLKCKLCFLSLSNIDVADLYQKAVNYFLLNSWCFSCPTCGMQQGSWIRYGTYSRWVITYSAVTGTVQTQLKIQRMLCRHCRSGGELHTHALLADFIVPYRQYSIQFILHFLMLYYTHQKSVEEICAEAGISPTQLYEWDRTITKNREIWSGILTFEQEQAHRQVLAEFVSYLREEVLYPDFAQQYCLKSPKSFLQRHTNPANSHRLRL